MTATVPEGFDLEGAVRVLNGARPQVYIGSRPDDTSPWTIRKLNVPSSALREAIYGQLLRQVKRLSGRQARPLSPTFASDSSSYAEADFDEVGSAIVQAIVSQYTKDGKRDLPPGAETPAELDEDPSETERPRFIAFLFHAEPRSDLVLIRGQSPVMEMRAGVVGTIERIAGELTLREAEWVFAWDGRVDLILWHGKAAVLNRTAYEVYLREPGEIELETNAVIDAIEKPSLFTGLEDLRSVAKDDGNFRRTLRRIAQAGHLAVLDRPKLSNAISRWGLEQVVEENQRLKFAKEGQGRWQFLRLISDGFLSSEMTGYRYEVSSKDRWKREQITTATMADGAVVSLGGNGWTAAPAAVVHAARSEGITYFVRLEDGQVVLLGLGGDDFDEASLAALAALPPVDG